VKPTKIVTQYIHN